MNVTMVRKVLRAACLLKTCRIRNSVKKEEKSEHITEMPKNAATTLGTFVWACVKPIASNAAADEPAAAVADSATDADIVLTLPLCCCCCCCCCYLCCCSEVVAAAASFTAIKGGQVIVYKEPTTTKIQVDPKS